MDIRASLAVLVAAGASGCCFTPTGEPNPAADAGSPDAAVLDAGPPTLCTIGGSTYADGASNPLNQCQSCQLAINAGDWTNLGAGSPCADGGICSDGACLQGCINTSSMANRCTNDNDCCPVLVAGVSKPVRCKDTVCQNDLNWACNSDVDCSPGNVCVSNLCKVVVNAIQCISNSDCESNDCASPTCTCFVDTTNNVTSAVSCCNGNLVGTTCTANTTRGNACQTIANCSTEETCGGKGTCCIPHTSREQCTKSTDCCDGTCNLKTSECCSAVAQTPCTFNSDCCQGLTCSQDTGKCLFVANNPGCKSDADCVPNLKCNQTTTACQ